MIPDDPSFVVWSILITVLVLFYLATVPVRIAFESTAPTSTYIQGQDGWWVFDVTCDVFFLVDLGLNFMTIIRVNGGDDIIEPLIIAQYHFSSIEFYVDLIASIPSSIIEGPQFSTHGTVSITANKQYLGALK